MNKLFPPVRNVMNAARSVWLLVALGLMSCSSIPMPQTQGVFKDDITPTADEAIVFIFRNQFALGGGGPTQVSVNRREALRLDNRGYSVLRLMPGCYEFAQRWLAQNPDVDSQPQMLCFEPGSKSYVRILADVRHVAGWAALKGPRATASFVPLPLAEAIKWLGECQLYPATSNTFKPLLQ